MRPASKPQTVVQRSVPIPIEIKHQIHVKNVKLWMIVKLVKIV
jgi:hypothetical protein